MLPQNKMRGELLNNEETWWSFPAEEIFSKLKTSKEGLIETEIKSRYDIYGKNVLPREKYKSLKLLLRQFKSPLLWILLVAVAVSAALGEVLNAVIILVMILLSSLLSFYDEYTSSRLVENLSKQIHYETTVIRNGKKKEIDISDLVPGDLVYISGGNRIPADLRLIHTNNLEINESVLTGESLTVHKQSNQISKSITRLQSLSNYGFAGTIVVSGEGMGIVITTGKNTEFGKIAQKTVEERPQTGFQKGISSFSKLLAKTIIILTVLIFLINAVLKHSVLDSLLFALAIAIGLTPELLPAVINVSLSKGAHAMSKKGVIVKRLIAIEDFGNIDILCTDKTGTLTEGNLSLSDYQNIEGKKDKNLLMYSNLCINQTKNKKIEPIDKAIISYSKKYIKESEISKFKIIDELPFDYERKRMSVIVRKDNKNILISRGSVLKILDASSKVLIKGKVSPLSKYKNIIDIQYKELSAKGYRVIAVAYKDVSKKIEYDTNEESSLIFLGFLLFSDPPKKNVKSAIDRLSLLGIELKILTGDNELITEHVADQVGIKLKGIVIGDEIEKLNDTQLQKVVENNTAFCRLTPLQKAKIIKALKQNGHEVGYMGDGINDVPALHEADVGISVNDAVDITKEDSDIILTKKSLDSLTQGVIEGRKIFSNTMKYIFISSSSNFGNMVSAAGASIFLPFLPMLPIQILLVNLLYDTSQLSIPTDYVDEDELKKPKKLNVDGIKKYMMIFGPISSVYDILTYFIMIVLFGASIALFRTGWFIESMITQLFVVFIIRTKKIPFYKSKPSLWVVLSILLVAIIVIAIPFSPLAGLLGFESPPLLFFVVLILMVITYLIIVEFVKGWFFRKYEF
ncbi:magnesium-translocating P-type ATPase [Candidatus Pacearchaeota archaeon CG10_big_fil_rev_8_21_14_0_10_32_14]|nr:MAG: magnesium-translocating P-type ATPase [Candidatus Pacearchaeota archaeon CG10_big_fil_rev_8_21_14_0_10_32_14]